MCAASVRLISSTSVSMADDSVRLPWVASGMPGNARRWGMQASLTRSTTRARFPSGKRMRWPRTEA